MVLTIFYQVSVVDPTYIGEVPHDFTACVDCKRGAFDRARRNKSDELAFFENEAPSGTTRIREVPANDVTHGVDPHREGA
jgi:hypothetical protein